MARAVAVLGGGQLGRMLAMAGLPLGLHFRFLDPSPEAPAGALGPLVAADLSDVDAAAEVARGTAVVTYEWEGVPARTVRTLARDHLVRPGPAALVAAQDRLVEKTTFTRLGIPTAGFAPVDSRDELDDAAASLGLPLVLKTRRGGYDGKGQRRIEAPGDLDPAWDALGGVPLLAEAHVDFRRELAVLATRATDGQVVLWPPVETVHRAGILRVARAPAAIDPERRARAEQAVRALAEHLDYVGTLCVEMFDAAGGLLANEFAPRVHNSGHWTIEGAVTSQFENHLRAVLDLPLGSTDVAGAWATVNCLGGLPDPVRVLAVPGAHLHVYDKQPRPGRKLGHVTVGADDDPALAPRLDAVLDAVAAATVEPTH